MNSGTEPSGSPMITLLCERAQAVPQRPVRRPMGPDRADAEGLEKGPALDRSSIGQPAKGALRDVFNASGIPWKYLPHDFPNHGTVYAYYAAWRDEGSSSSSITT